MEEDTSRNIGAVMTEGGSPELTDKDSDRDSVYQIYDIGAMTSQIIGSIKVASIPSRNVSETKATLKDVPQAKTFQSKGRHSAVSPEELSEQRQIGLKHARETILQNNTNNHSLRCNVPSEAIQGGQSVPDKRLTGMRDTDTMEGRLKSLYGNLYAQVFSNGTYFADYIQWIRRLTRNRQLRHL